MEFLDEIKEGTLLIVEDELYENILEYLTQKDKLIKFKLLSQSEFIKRYFYDYTSETVYYVVKNYHTNINNARIYLDNMKYVLTSTIDNPKVKYLKDMYQDLKAKQLLIFDQFFKDYLNTIKIKVLITAPLEPFLKAIFDNYQVSYQEIKRTYQEKTLKAYHFKGIEEEVAFVFSSIATLINNGVEITKIKLTNVTSEYISYLKRMAKFYHLKINKLDQYGIYGTETIKRLLQMIKARKSKEELLEVINKNFEKDIYIKFFNILNRYYFVDDLNEVIDFLEEDLKKATLKGVTYENALEIIPLNSFLTSEDDYVFLLGFNLENIPKTFLDIDYLNDELKSKLGLYTSVQKNVLQKEEVLFHLNNFANLVISYKDTTPYQTYFPTSLIENMEVIDEEPAPSLMSNLYNKILLTEKLDTLLKYGEETPYLGVLLNSYPELPYLTYDNKFGGIKDTFQHLTLSYTSLNNYYHCAFRYYIDNILKLNIYEDSFKIYIGNLFHYVLSKMFEPDFSYQETYQEFLKGREFTPKEEFYLDILEEELKDIIEIIKYQHELSGLTKVMVEKEVKLELLPNFIFKGIIDKIMYREKDNNTYLSLIDYKTGTPKTDMTNLVYGIDMQLPIYLYLIKKSNIFANLQVIGFYFEQIIHEKGNFEVNKSQLDQKKDKLKLEGYTIADTYLVNLFDASYENSELIRGMKLTKNGFAKNAKVLSDAAITKLIEIVDKKIAEAFVKISQGEFSINPKVIGGNNLGCAFCKYQDLCFKNGKDLVYLEKNQDLSCLEGDEVDAKVD